MQQRPKAMAVLVMLAAAGGGGGARRPHPGRGMSRTCWVRWRRRCRRRMASSSSRACTGSWDGAAHRAVARWILLPLRKLDTMAAGCCVAMDAEYGNRSCRAVTVMFAIARWPSDCPSGSLGKCSAVAAAQAADGQNQRILVTESDEEPGEEQLDEAGLELQARLLVKAERQQAKAAKAARKRKELEAAEVRWLKSRCTR